MNKKPASKTRLVDLTHKPLLSVREVCQLIGLPASTMAKLDHEGKGPRWLYLGRRKFVRRASFDSWLQQRESESKATQLSASPQ